jgi:hypothetical protein
MEGEHAWMEQGALGVYPLAPAHGRFLREPASESEEKAAPVSVR